MTAMSYKFNGLFSIGEEFDDEDLLDSAPPLPPGPAGTADAGPCGTLRAPSVKACQTSGPSDGLTVSKAPASAQPLRQISSAPCLRPSAPGQTGPQTKPAAAAAAAQDDFDDWDVDLADLEEWDQCPQPMPLPPATVPRGSLRPLRPPEQPPPRLPAPVQIPSPLPQSPTVFSGFSATSPLPRTHNQPPKRTWATPRAAHQPPHSLFGTVSPAPSPSSLASPSPLNTPVLTNRLVQLVSASSRVTKKRPSSEPRPPRTRRFPGPAGLLPQQPQGQSLNDIVMPVPQPPADGAVARIPSQDSGSQTDDEEFSGAAWAAMKAEMGLDERNPLCFLRSFSVIMVLRKAAFKQLEKNKVPNMAVMLKSMVHTQADAKAVFRDPTGEIQGTVHRRLLEERAGELKPGVVLLLKQVGVFSPSHRNHYLNVTPNNLLRIYGANGVALTSTPLPPQILNPYTSGRCAGSGRQPVSRMQLLFDEDEEEQVEGHVGGADPRPTGNSGWDEDDDLDDLLGQLPDDTYSL
ncbi:homologous recombination OB-fold protein isoform X2 [Synchiropus splendidus]|uniref:homologous recombination OB-fold protein isoform X2 n=1 Tax=Synchiropus splendidus TaxID=270530 RepID=UPI00237EC68C|nr:homologous recombination OB-fold protein isoform X2 [Synchiropus splendidus]